MINVKFFNSIVFWGLPFVTFNSLEAQGIKHNKILVKQSIIFNFRFCVPFLQKSWAGTPTTLSSPQV